jgi:hypothetical protein
MKEWGIKSVSQNIWPKRLHLHSLLTADATMSAFRVHELRK